MLKNLSIVLLVSTASAMYGCPHASVGDEEGMLREADCLFRNSDMNRDGILSHESTKDFVRKYLEDRELEQDIINDIEERYGRKMSKDEFYGVYGYMKYHESKQ